MGKVICLVFLAFFLNAQSTDAITINGYFSFEYEKMFDDEGKGDPNGSFDADLIDIVFNFQLSQKLRIATDLTWEHGSASEDGYGNVAVEYAFVEYSLSDAFKFRAGKMFTNFGIYNEIHTAKPAFTSVKEPQSTNKNHKFGSSVRFYPRWQNGIAFTGNLNVGERPLNYILQISNGTSEGLNPYEEDDNTSKAITSRILYSATDDLRLGVSFYMDKMQNYDDAGEDLGTTSSLSSFGFQAEWELNEFKLELEGVTGSFEDIDRFGFTVMGEYTLQEKYTPYIRFEDLDPNKDIEKDNANLLIIGINTEIEENFFLKIEVDMFSSEDANSRLKGKSYSEFKAAIAIGF